MMGTLVTATANHNTKSNYATATVAAGAVSVAQVTLGLFVGTATGAPLEAYNGLLRCAAALREAGSPNPDSAWKVSAAVYDCVAHQLAVSNGDPPTLAETDVAVIQGMDFTTGGDSNVSHVRRMAEHFLESAKAA
jgi:hypothetical protein